MQRLGCEMVSKIIDPRHHIRDANYTGATSNRNLHLGEEPFCIRMFGTNLPNPKLGSRRLDQIDFTAFRLKGKCVSCHVAG